MKNKKIILLVSVLVMAIILLVWLYLGNRKTFLTDPFRAIPPDAVVIIEPRDLQGFIFSLTGEEGIAGELLKAENSGRVGGWVNFLADQFNRDWFKNMAGGTPSVISFHSGKNGQTEILLSVVLLQDAGIRQVKETLLKAGVSGVTEVNSGKLRYIKFPCSGKTGADSLCFAIKNGLLLISSSEEIVVSSASMTPGENDVRNLPGFSGVFKASGRNEDKLYIVFSNLPPVIKPLFNAEKLSVSEKIGIIAAVLGADIHVDKSGIMFAGYTSVVDSTSSLFRFTRGSAGVFTTYTILPSATSFLESSFEEDPMPGVRTGVTVSDTALKLASLMRPFIGNEIARAMVVLREGEPGPAWLYVYRLNDRVSAERVFTDEFSRISGDDNKFNFSPDEAVNIPVYKTPFRGFYNTKLPYAQTPANDTWFAFYDNYLVTGSSYAVIARLLYDNLLNKTLANDVFYRDFEAALPSVAKYFLYMKPASASDYLSQYLDPGLFDQQSEKGGLFTRFNAAGMRLIPANGMIYTSVSLKHSDDIAEKSDTQWETLLDTVAAIKPFFFRNHLTGASEIFIQDLRNNIYLINSTGRVLWKVPLSERITSQVFMIDYFKNGRYQMLFSGRNNLHLIDRNGNYVERFPVKLRSPASAPMSLFDYDNNKEYRIIIPGEDKNIYAYDKTGSVVKGWKNFRTNGTVTSEIAWLRVSGKDYIIASDESALYFLDRTGSTRLNLKEQVLKAKGSAIRLVTSRTPYVICSAPDGTLEQIFFDGTVKKITIKSFSVDHTFDIFDISGDGIGEYIFIDKGILYLYNQNGDELFSKEFGTTRLEGPIPFVFSASHKMIGVYETDKKLIYLIGKTGNIMEGFPLRGASMFSIGRLSDKGEWNLIVGGADKFLYNYSLITEK